MRSDVVVADRGVSPDNHFYPAILSIYSVSMSAVKSYPFLPMILMGGRLMAVG